MSIKNPRTQTLLVTGGTGCLGQPTVAQLGDAGFTVRVLSRKAGGDRTVGDLDTGVGLAAALVGVDTVLHLATNRKNDTDATARLLGAARAASVKHVLYISIVGIDLIPLGYYASKLECERLIETSGIPYTILRATQFHNFVSDFLAPQRRLPWLTAPAIPVQPIAIEEVAGRLVELADAEPAGRVPDIGGPERGDLRGFAGQWQEAFATHKPVWSPRIPGKLIAAFNSGHNMTALPGFGTQSFAEYASIQAASAERAD